MQACRANAPGGRHSARRAYRRLGRGRMPLRTRCGFEPAHPGRQHLGLQPRRHSRSMAPHRRRSPRRRACSAIRPARARLHARRARFAGIQPPHAPAVLPADPPIRLPDRLRGRGAVEQHADLLQPRNRGAGGRQLRPLRPVVLEQHRQQILHLGGLPQEGHGPALRRGQHPPVVEERSGAAGQYLRACGTGTSDDGRSRSAEKQVRLHDFRHGRHERLRRFAAHTPVHRRGGGTRRAPRRRRTRPTTATAITSAARKTAIRARAGAAAPTAKRALSTTASSTTPKKAWRSKSSTVSRPASPSNSPTTTPT